MTRRLVPPEPLRATSTEEGLPLRVYRRRWYTVTHVVDRWVQRGLWWDEIAPGAPGADRHYARIVLDSRLIWDVYHEGTGIWYLSASWWRR